MGIISFGLRETEPELFIERITDDAEGIIIIEGEFLGFHQLVILHQMAEDLTGKCLRIIAEILKVFIFQLVSVSDVQERSFGVREMDVLFVRPMSRQAAEQIDLFEIDIEDSITRIDASLLDVRIAPDEVVEEDKEVILHVLRIVTMAKEIRTRAIFFVETEVRHSGEECWESSRACMECKGADIESVRPAEGQRDGRTRNLVGIFVLAGFLLLAVHSGTPLADFVHDNRRREDGQKVVAAICHGEIHLVNQL